MVEVSWDPILKAEFSRKERGTLLGLDTVIKYAAWVIVTIAFT